MTHSGEFVPPKLDGKVGFERMLLVSEHRERLLAKALGDLLVAIGGATAGMPLTGPELLMLAEDATTHFVRDGVDQ